MDRCLKREGCNSKCKFVTWIQWSKFLSSSCFKWTRGPFNDAVQEGSSMQHISDPNPELFSEIVVPFSRFQDFCPLADLTPFEVSFCLFNSSFISCLTYRCTRSPSIEFLPCEVLQWWNNGKWNKISRIRSKVKRSKILTSSARKTWITSEVLKPLTWIRSKIILVFLQFFEDFSRNLMGNPKDQQLRLRWIHISQKLRR